MCLPAVMLQVCLSGSGLTVGLCRRTAFERSVKTAVVVIILECCKLPLQINWVPEYRRVWVANCYSCCYGLWSAEIHAAFDTKPYSWCNPPRIGWATTLQWLGIRCRCLCGVTGSSTGGSGMPGPRLLWGQTALYLVMANWWLIYRGKLLETSAACRKAEVV